MTHRFLKGFISRSWRKRISTKNNGPATSTRPEATLGIGQEGPGIIHRLHLAWGEGVQGTRNEGNEESRQGRRESAQGQAGGAGAQSGTAGSPFTGGSHQGDASSPSRRGGARQEARGSRGNSPPIMNGAGEWTRDSLTATDPPAGSSSRNDPNRSQAPPGL